MSEEQELNPHAASLLKAEYGSHVAPMIAKAPGHFTAPSPDLIDHLQNSANENFGIPVGAVADWTVWLTAVMAAITTQNWLALFPLVLQLGSYVPQAWAFIKSIIDALHGKPPVSPAGPTIHGS